MSWGRFALGLLIVFLLQTTLVRLLGPPLVDLFLVYALLLGFLLPVYDARLAAWIAGLAQDLGSDDALGTHAFALGLAAIILTQLRGTVNAGLPWVRWLIAMLAAVPVLLLLSIHAAFWHGAATPSWWTELGMILLMAAVAAAVAAGLTPLFGPRRRLAGSRR